MSVEALSVGHLRRRGRRPSSIRGALGVGVFGLIVASAAFAPLIAPHDPLAQDVVNRLAPPVWAAGSWTNPLGTDQLGRDTLSRLLHGGQVSLLVGVTATAAAGLIGFAMGLISGFFGGRLDSAIQSLAYAQLTLPFVLLAIAVVAALGPSLPVVVFVLVISGWVIFTRVVRGSVLSLKEQPFVEAGRMVGLSNLELMAAHIVPHVVGVFLVLLTIQLGRMLILESALSFLGLGVQPPQPTWGGMIAEARNYIWTAPDLAIVPGVAIVVTVLSVSAMAGWLRDLLDPRRRAGGEGS